MTPWLLLLLTVGSAYVTYDAFRWSGSVESAPFSVIASMWKGGLSNLPVVKQDEIKQRYASKLLGGGQFCWLFLTITVILAILTVRSFTS